MAKTKTSTEEIIEKKESTPVASASLVLSFVAMLAAIVFCVLEVMEYRRAPLARGDTPGMATAEADLARLRQDVNGILNDQALPDVEGDDEEDEDEDFEEEEPADEDFEEEEPADEDVEEEPADEDF